MSAPLVVPPGFILIPLVSPTPGQFAALRASGIMSIVEYGTHRAVLQDGGRYLCTSLSMQEVLDLVSPPPSESPAPVKETKHQVAAFEGIPTIGELLSVLCHLNHSMPVYLEDGSPVTKVESWRGIYAEAALGYEILCPPRTVGALVAALEASIDGRVYMGWKGGDYRFNKSTPLHVDNPGDCSGRFISAVEVDRGEVVLKLGCDRE